MTRWLTLAGVVVILDQLSKFAVTRSLTYGSGIEITPFFNLVLVHNKGAAFSFLSSASGWQREFFIAVAVIAIAWVGEPDASLVVDGEIVRAVKFFARVFLGSSATLGCHIVITDHRCPAVRLIAHNPPPALLVSPQDAKNAVRAAILEVFRNIHTRTVQGKSANNGCGRSMPTARSRI